MFRSRVALTAFGFRPALVSILALLAAAPASAGGWHWKKERVILVQAPESRTVRVIQRTVVREPVPAAAPAEQSPSGPAAATRDLPAERDLTFERSLRALTQEPVTTDRDLKPLDRSIRAIPEPAATADRYYVREVVPVRVREVAQVDRVIVREIVPVERVIVREVVPVTRAIVVQPATKHHLFH